MFYGQGANMALPIWALYMKKVYANNSLGVTQSDKFELVPTHKLDTEIDCDKYRRDHSANYEGVPPTF
jgi:penicillin-binding protein 1A